MTAPKVHRALMVAAACFQNFACGGLIFGWAAISSTFLLSDDGGPGLPRRLIHQLFVMATSVNFTGPLLLGIVLDAYGPRACSIISITLVMGGFILFGISNTTFYAYVPAIMMIAFGGPGVQSSIIHLSNLYPTRKATVTSVITGSFNLSFIVFFLFDRIWARTSANYHEIFLGYAVVCFLALLITIFLWPDQPFTYEEQILEEVGLLDRTISKEIGAIRAPSVFKHASIGRPAYQPAPTRLPSTPERRNAAQKGEKSGLLSSGGSKNGGSIKDATFWEQLKSAVFIRMTLLMLVGSFWANFYIGTIDIQLADANHLPQEAQDFLVKIFTAITTMGVLGIPVAGRLMDHWGFTATAVVTVTLAVFYGVGVLWKDEAQLIAAFTAYALFRTFLFTYFFAYLGNALGFRYFGVLSGVAFFAAGLVSMLQSPVMDWAAGTCHLTYPPQRGCDNGRWEVVNFIQLACLAALYVIPFWDSQDAKVHEDQHKGAGGKVGSGGGRPVGYGASVNK